MNCNPFPWGGAAAAAYLAAAVVCFGPATVQSEKARDAYLTQCRAEHKDDPDRRRLCPLGGPFVIDGAVKALFWPLWLSYLAASR